MATKAEEDLSVSSINSNGTVQSTKALAEAETAPAEETGLRDKLLCVVSHIVQDSSLAELEDILDYIEVRRHRKRATNSSVPRRPASPTGDPGGGGEGAVVVKRPRGRPKKESLAHPSDSTPLHSLSGLVLHDDGDAASSPPPPGSVKRSRGRPRKYPRKDPPAVRRGPGRPRKTVLSGGAATPRPRPSSKLLPPRPKTEGDFASDFSRDEEEDDESTERSGSQQNAMSSSPDELRRSSGPVVLNSILSPPERWTPAADEEASSAASSESRRPIASRVGIGGASVADLMLQSPAVDPEVRSSIPLAGVEAIPPPPLLLQPPPPPALDASEEATKSMIEAFGLKDEELNLVCALRAFEKEMAQRSSHAAPA